MTFEPTGLRHIEMDNLHRIDVGPGCTRYDLPSRNGMRAWVVDIAVRSGRMWTAMMSSVRTSSSCRAS
ncbi:hypothetical protein [Sphingomonas sp. UYP23]